MPLGAWVITRKDLLQLARDRRAVAMLLALPLIFIAIIGTSTGQLLGWQRENQLLKLALINNDGGVMSKRLERRLQQIPSSKILQTSDVREAEHWLDEGSCVAIVTIGPEFQNRTDDLTITDILNTRRAPLNEGLPAFDITVKSRESTVSTGSIVNTLVFGMTLQAVAPPIALRHPLAKQILKRELEAFQNETGESDTRFNEVAASANAGLSTSVYQKVVPSYTVLFVFFLLNIMARSFISERELGTLRRLRMAPIDSWQILVGKTLPYLFISLAQSIVLFVAGRFMFGMSWGTQPVWLLAVIICTSCAATTLGLLVATLVKTDSQVSAYSTSLVLTLGGISGCFMPRDWLPTMMQNISLATPHAWALIAYDQLLNRQEPSMKDVLQCCGALLSFALAFFSLGLWRFQKMD